MTQSGPMVSIIMNCFNGERYLDQALESVLNQTYPNWELVFWDNRSNDRSKEIFLSYSDERFKYFLAEEFSNISIAKNLALSKAGGEYYAFLDVDDWWTPEKLEYQLRLFKDPDVGIVCSNYYLVNEAGLGQSVSRRRPIKTGWVLSEQLRSYSLGLLTIMIRASQIPKPSSALDERYHIIGDFDLAIRVLMKSKLNYSHKCLAFNRIHSASQLKKNRMMHISEMRQWSKSFNEETQYKYSSEVSHVLGASHYLEAQELASKGKYLAALTTIKKSKLSKFTIFILIRLLVPKNCVTSMKNLFINK